MDNTIYIGLLETQLRSLFLLIKSGKRPTEGDRRYTEGLVHAAQALQAMTAAEIQDVMERINAEVFGISIAERQKQYPTEMMPIGLAEDLPTFQRRGIHLK